MAHLIFLLDVASHGISLNQSESIFIRVRSLFFLKMGQPRPLFVYSRHFLVTISVIQTEKSIDGMLGIRTRGRRMVGADVTTELWRPPRSLFLLITTVVVLVSRLHALRERLDILLLQSISKGQIDH